MIRMNLYLSVAGISIGFGTGEIELTVRVLSDQQTSMFLHMLLSITLIFLCAQIIHSAAVAGFFGMNVINGLEEVEGVFALVVLSSCLFGGGFMAACFSYLEGTK